MEKSELEHSYAIHIEKKDEYYLVYNYFGRMILKTKNLSDIKKEMEKRNERKIK